MKLRIFLREPVALHCVGFIDRRGPRELEAARALEQARADYYLEQSWRQAVRDNPVERRRIARGEAYRERSYLPRKQAG